MNLKIMIMVLLSMSLFLTVQNIGVSALETAPPTEPLVVNEAENGTVEKTIEEILGIIPKFFETLIEILLSPFKAFASVWTNWGETLGDWYGPILGFFVIVVCVVMWRLYSKLDQFLDKGQ
jgi:hypothetical protein